MSEFVELQLTLTVSEEKRVDRWAVRSQDFGFTVYGHTLEEAKKAFREAVSTLVNSFKDDDARLREYLDKKGVQHRFAREDPGSPERTGERHYQQSFEVSLIGAT